MYLKHCPCCGSKEAPRVLPVDGVDLVPIDLGDLGDFYAVACEEEAGGCGLRTAPAPTGVQALEAWNQRAD